jgi:hypothetical protein
VKNLFLYIWDTECFEKIAFRCLKVPIGLIVLSIGCVLLNDATSVQFVIRHTLLMFWGGFKTQCSDLHGFSALLRSAMPWWLLSISWYCFLNVLKKWRTGCANSVTLVSLTLCEEPGHRVSLTLNSVNQLIFVMVKSGVLFEVRTEF